MCGINGYLYTGNISKNEIKIMLSELEIKNFKIIENRFLGLVSNFLLVIKK